MIENESPMEKVMESLNLKSREVFRVKLTNVQEMNDEMLELEDFFGRTKFSLDSFGLRIAGGRRRYGENVGLLLKKAFYAICTGKCLVQKIKGIDVRTIFPADWQNRSRPPQGDESDTLILMRKSIANLLGVEAGVSFYLVCKRKREFSIMDEIPPAETDSEENEEKSKNMANPEYVHLGIVRQDSNFLYPVKLHFSEDDWSLSCADWMLDSNGDIPQEDLGKYWDALLHGKVSVVSDFHEEFGVVSGFYFDNESNKISDENLNESKKKKKGKGK